MPAELVTVFGPMYSGKSETILRLIHLEELAGRTVVALKPYVDDRTMNFIASRAVDANGEDYFTQKFPATVIRENAELAALLYGGHDTVVIDECQFLTEHQLLIIRNALCKRRNDNFRLICGGLDLDYALKPFGPMPQLIGMADERIPLTGICMSCRSRGASLTQRTAGGTGTVQTQKLTERTYEIRCRNCHYIYGVEEPR